MRLRYGLVKYEQLSIEDVRLDWLAQYTRIENAHKVLKKTFVFCDRSPQEMFVPTGKMCWTYIETIGHSF